MNIEMELTENAKVSAGCHINDVMNNLIRAHPTLHVSAGCHINDVMNITAYA